MIEEPLWARCSLGRRRWYWVVYRCYSDLYDDVDPIATGYTHSPEECESAALAIAANAIRFHTSLAAGHHRKLCILRRMQKPSNSTDAVQQEFLYTDHDHGGWWDGIGDEWYSQAHRIIKVTRRSVFVEKNHWRPEMGLRAYDVEQHRLDRNELMTNGEVWSNQARDRYYTKPYEERRQYYRPQYLVELDLPAGATKDQIKSQYCRLAKANHPDCGGDAEQFKRIIAAYEEAKQRA